MSLVEIQRGIASLVMQPLTSGDAMRQRTMTGRSVVMEANRLIKPNKLLTSFERLEIYNRQYWFRVLSCFGEDFPGLRAIIGARKFEALSRAYLAECPSVSFTLRNLGSRLERWLLANPQWIGSCERLALDMVRIEWAHIEAFDGDCEPPVSLADLESAGLDIRISLQPYVRLLELEYAVDDLLIEVHDYAGETDISTNSASHRQLRRRLRHYANPEHERIYLAVHRLDDSVYYKRLQPESYRMLKALSEQKSLEQAIDLAFDNRVIAESDSIATIAQWFANWAELGWFSPARN